MPASSRNRDVAADFETDPKQRQVLVKELQPGAEPDLAWAVLPPKYRCDYANLPYQLSQATDVLSQAFKSLRHEVAQCCQALQPTMGGSDRTKVCRTAVLALQLAGEPQTADAKNLDVVVCACTFAVLHYAPTKDTALLALFMAPAPEYRGRGLEALLVSQLKVFAAAKGCKVMFSNVINTPGASQQFWSQLGFSDAKTMALPEGMSAAGFRELQRQAREAWSMDTLLWACSEMNVSMDAHVAQTRSLWSNPQAVFRSPAPPSTGAKRARSTPASGGSASAKKMSITPPGAQQQVTVTLPPPGARLLTPEQLQQRVKMVQQQQAAAVIVLPHADSPMSSDTAMQGEHTAGHLAGLHEPGAARGHGGVKSQEKGAKHARSTHAVDVSDGHLSNENSGVGAVAVLGLPEQNKKQGQAQHQALQQAYNQQRSKQSLGLLLQALNGSTLKGAQVKRPASNTQKMI